MPNAQNIDKILKDCLFRDGEDQSTAVVAKGIVTSFGFHPERLKDYHAEIVEELSSLPREFYANGGGGWSFLNMCNDNNGVQWGEHRSMEQLVCLGIALELVKELMPDMRDAMPGGVPYYVVDLREISTTD